MAGTERRALWIYPWDILDSGIDETVRRAKNEWGLSALSLATSYHSAKFLLPKRSRERVFLSEGSAIYFRPNDEMYRGSSLRPLVTRRGELLDVLDQTAEACHRHGMTLRAWTVGLHNSRLGEAHPGACLVNVFGDTYPWALCPANPEARTYQIGLVKDLATNHGLDAIDLESVGFHGLTHGHHHELIGITFGPIEEFLMGLCFCQHCLDRAGAAGLDGERLRAQVAAVLERRFSEEASLAVEAPDRSQVLSLLANWPALMNYVRVRQETVTSMVRDVKAQAIAGTGVDLAMTTLTFYRGVDNAWLEGVDVHSCASSDAADEVILLSYFPTVGQVTADIRFAQMLVPEMDRVVVGMSLLAQGTTSGANLREKVQAARDLGTTKFSFYNYGFISEERLSWLGTL